jgi:hypothetical protein
VYDVIVFFQLRLYAGLKQLRYANVFFRRIVVFGLTFPQSSKKWRDRVNNPLFTAAKEGVRNNT